MVPWAMRRVADLPPNAKPREMQQNTHGPVQLIGAATPDDESISPTQGATQFVDCESMSPTKRAILRIVWCGYGVRQSREGVENGHGWGMGPKRCPAR